MSEEDVKQITDEAAKQAPRFLPLMRDVTGGVSALTIALVAASMALGKFRAIYKGSKKVTS